MTDTFLKAQEIIALGAELESVKADKFTTKADPKDTDAAPNKLNRLRNQLQNCPAIARLAIARRMLKDISEGRDQCAVLLYCLAASLPDIVFKESPAWANIPSKSRGDYAANMLSLRDEKWSNRGDKVALCNQLILACLYFVHNACDTGHLPKNWPVNPEIYKKLVPSRMDDSDMVFAAAAYINDFAPDAAKETARKITGLQPPAVSPLAHTVLRFLNAKSQGRIL